MSGPHSVARIGCPVRKKGLPECVRHPGRECARDQEAAGDVEPDGGPIHYEIVADRGETSVGGHSPPKRAALGDGHVHFGMAFHAAGNALIRLDLGWLEKVLGEKRPEQKDQEREHQRRADEFGQCQLPAQERHHDYAELDDEIGGGHLKRHRGREMCALAEDRTGKRHSRVGA